jgi:hypothetical protein
VTRLSIAPFVVLMSMAAAACGDGIPTPTSASVATESVDATTRLFIGTLAPRGSAFFSFTVPQDSGVFLTLASLTAAGGRGALTVPLVLGLGVPRGTGCATTTTVVTTADLAAQIREWRAAGVYCASLVDQGRLGADAAFAIRIGYYE